MKDEGWPELRPLMRHPLIGAATKLCFSYMWLLGGRAPAYVIITAQMLGYELGRSARAAGDLIKTMVRWGLAEILQRDAQGRYHLLIYRPNPADPGAARPDPQLLLPIIVGNPADACKAPTTAETPEVPFANDGPTSGVCAQKPPTSSHERPEKQDFRAPPSGVCAQKPPRKLNVPMESKESKEKSAYISPKVQSTVRSNGPIGAGGLRAETPEAVEADPGPIGAAVAEVFRQKTAAVAEASRYQDACRRPAEKRRLRERIADAAGIDAGAWLSGAAADLVLEYGVDQRIIEQLLSQVLRRRRLPEEDARHIRNGGGWLNYRLRKLAAEVGMKWPGETTEKRR